MQGIVVGGLESGEVKVFSLSRGVFKETQNLLFHKSAVLSIAFHKDKIVSCSYTGDLAFWRREGSNFAFDKSIHLFNGAILSVASAGDYFICGCSDGKIRVVTEEGTISNEVFAHKRGVSGVSLWDNKLAVTGGVDGLVKIWNIPEFTLAKEFKTHTAAVRDCKVSNNCYGKLVFASCSEDESVVIYTRDKDGDSFTTERLPLGFPGVKATWGITGHVLAVGSFLGQTKIFVPHGEDGWRENVSLLA